MNMSYLKLNVILAALLALSFGGISCAKKTEPTKPTKPTKPNIIFILTDDLGYGDLGVLFQNRLKTENNRSQPWAFTPNLDRMAEQGALLPQHYCAAPVCAPSRASLMLGVSQGHSNVRDNQFDKALADNHTLGSVMKAIGYSTAAVGKWGLQGDDRWDKNGASWPAHPNKRGFDYFYGYIRHKDGHEHYPKEGIYDGPKEVYENYNNVADGLDKCYTADLWTAAAKKWIIEQKKAEKKPFFLYLAYDTPHAVLELPTQPYPKGGGLNGGMQWIGKPSNMINTASGDVDSWIHPDYANATYDDDKNPDTPEVAWPDVYKRYATDTRRIDDAVGDIMQLLKDLNIDKNTMIVFTSDNGPSIESYLKDEPVKPTFFKSFGPFDGTKRDCWEGGVRMPTIAMWPGHIPSGEVVKTPSISYDWLSTFTEMAGIPAPANTDGISLLPSLTGKGKQKEGLVYVEYYQKGKTPKFSDFAKAHQGRRRNQMQMIRLGDFVGVRYDIQSQQDNFEIYNILKDPQQTTDLSGKSEMVSIQKKMKDMVLQSRRPNESAPRPYDNELIPAVDTLNPAPGVTWNAFNGDFPWVPDTSFLTSSQSGLTNLPSVSIAKTNDVICLTGYIKVPTSGNYTFSLLTNSGALLRIHNCTVIDEDFGFKGGERSGSILLEAGMHPFKLTYKRKANTKDELKLEWSGEGFAKQTIPASVFFHD
jgi:arylsulfatase A-like enzyme